MVLSGDLAELEEIEKRRGGKFLKGSVAYHSWQMDEVEKEFRRSVREPERGAAAHEAGPGEKRQQGLQREWLCIPPYTETVWKRTHMRFPTGGTI